jgi:FAD/FMN-containing dehydrogenase
LGIATWASIKCQVLPKLHRLFFIPSDRLDNLIGFLYKILRFRFGDELFILNNWGLAAILGDTPAQIKSLSNGLPPWITLLGIAGRDVLPAERVEFQEKDIADIAQQFGLRMLSSVAGVEAGEVLGTILNASPEPYWKLNYQGGCQDIFFLTTLERTPDFVKTMHSIAELHQYHTSEIGVYLQPVHQGASCHCEFSLHFDQDNPAEVNRMKDLSTKASEELQRQGAFFSRPYGIWADMAFNQDPQTTIALKKIKNIFDPNNVMNPGKLCFNSKRN